MQITKLVKRNGTELVVEKISNGFLVTLNGRDSNEDWMIEKIFVENLDKVQQLSDQYFKLLVC